MKKLALSLAVIFSLNIQAADHNDTLALQTTENNTPESAPAGFRVANFQSQAPILAEYFIGSLGSGLVTGTLANLVPSPLDESYALEKAAYIGVLTALLRQNTDKEYEEIRCAQLAQNCNENILRACRQFVENQIVTDNEEAITFYTNELFKRMETFQPEQFQIQNRAYSAVATVLGFAAGAYVGAKLGTRMSYYCGELFKKLYPTTINDNHIDLAHTVPQQ